MNCDPLDLALQHVSETKHLLDTLLTSSEQFDYPKAKIALKQLRVKVRELHRLQAQMNERPTEPNICRVDFVGVPRTTERR